MPTMIDIRTGDCLAGMAAMEPASVHAVVTDPPYELAFMGRKWDSTGISFRPETWAAALRVAKPGAHLVAFGGTRTWHRIAVAIEDGGWEVRDTLCWLHGQGFPKSLDVSKAIDKAAGAEREVVGRDPSKWRDASHYAGRKYSEMRASDYETKATITAPASAASAAWEGWGTALKPAFEPIILARKRPAGTVAANVLQHGTGALNIDGCRIGTTVETWPVSRSYAPGQIQPGGKGETQATGEAPAGRWPANVVLDEEAAAMLDEQSGDLPTGTAVNRNRGTVKASVCGFTSGHSGRDETFGDSGGASRFFYTAKASRSDRGAENTHATVKPTALMRWLVKLVTPPGGLVLDPFLGSGTTALACFLEGFSCIGFEQDEAHATIARNRIRDEAPLFADEATPCA